MDNVLAEVISTAHEGDRDTRNYALNEITLYSYLRPVQMIIYKGLDSSVL